MFIKYSEAKIVKTDLNLEEISKFSDKKEKAIKTSDKKEKSVKTEK